MLCGISDALSLCGDFRILAEAIVMINPQWGDLWRDRRVVPHRLGCVTDRANVECAPLPAKKRDFRAHVLILLHMQVIDFDEAEEMLADEMVHIPRGEGEVYEHEIVSGKFGQVLAVYLQFMLMNALFCCLPAPHRLRRFSNDSLKVFGGLIFF